MSLLIGRPLSQAPCVLDTAVIAFASRTSIRRTNGKHLCRSGSAITTVLLLTTSNGLWLLLLAPGRSDKGVFFFYT